MSLWAMLFAQFVRGARGIEVAQAGVAQA
jgi:hypothetical protein